jgi:hypothetical protein
MRVGRGRRGSRPVLGGPAGALVRFGEPLLGGPAEGLVHFAEPLVGHAAEPLMRPGDRVLPGERTFGPVEHAVKR